MAHHGWFDRRGTLQAFNHLDKADTFDVDDTIRAADTASYDGLVLPSGVANPDFLRTQLDAVAFTRSFFDVRGPVAVICDGPWTPVEADVVKPRTLTIWPSLQDRFRNAGETWVDEQVHVRTSGPNTVVSSRNGQ